MSADTIAVSFRGHSVHVPTETLRAAIAEPRTVRAVRMVLPCPEEREAIGLVTLSDASEFLHCLHLALTTSGLVRLRAPRGRSRRS